MFFRVEWASMSDSSRLCTYIRTIRGDYGSNTSTLIAGQRSQKEITYDQQLG